MKNRINPAVLGVLTTQMLMEPAALAQMQQRLLALPPGIDLSVKYATDRQAPRADLFDSDGGGGDGGDRQKSRKPYEMAGGVAVVRLSGVLQKDPSWLMRYYGGTSTRAFTAMLALAEGDPDVSNILILVDSPGGTVDGTADAADAADAVYAVRQRGKKPIVAAVDGMCCSAAYWIASQAGKLYCGQTDALGSIGTRWRLLDTSGYYEQLGIKPVEVTSGTYKAAGADGLPVGADAVAYIQSLVDDWQARFSAGVVRGRPLTTDAVRALAADAKVYVGKAALDAGLADQILPVRDVIRQLQKGAPTTGTTASIRGKGADMADKGFKAAFARFMAQFGEEGDDETPPETDPAALASQVRTLTAQNTALTAEKEGLSQKLQGYVDAEQKAQNEALEAARSEARSAATTAFGAGSAELATAEHLIGAMASTGVLASMTAAYKHGTPPSLRPGAPRQTAGTGTVTTEQSAQSGADFYAEVRAQGEKANRTAAK